MRNEAKCYSKTGSIVTGFSDDTHLVNIPDEKYGNNNINNTIIHSPPSSTSSTTT